MRKTNTLFSTLLVWHQRMGVAVCIAIIAWALSGLAHPIITRLNPAPAALSAPQVELATAQLAPLPDLLKKNHITQINSLRLFQWQEQPIYRIDIADHIVYINAITQNVIDKGDEHYAEFLARHFLGDEQSQINKIERVENYDEDYLYVNRYLPVMRVSFLRDDNARVYIDTKQGRLATIVDNNKAVTSQIFRTMHSWMFIKNSYLRKGIMLLFLSVGFLVALMGIVLYYKSRRLNTFRIEHPITRRLHRHVGIAVAFPAVLFSLSGILHLLITEKPTSAPAQHHISVPSTGLTLAHLHHLVRQPVSSIQLTSINGTAYWQIKPLKKLEWNNPSTPIAAAEHQHGNHTTPSTPDTTLFMNAQTGELLNKGNELLTRYLVLQLTSFSAKKITQIETINAFTGEYGFINKRLPVQKITFDTQGSPSVYIETSSNTLASIVTNSDRIEGYSFAYLHKWHFIDVLGKTTRDTLTSLIALGICVVIGLGAYRYLFKRRRIKHR